MVTARARERSAAVCAEKRRARWREFVEEAEREWQVFSSQPDFMFGLALYVGEGNKAGRERISICNCEPAVLRRALAFFERYLAADRNRVRAHVHLHVEGDAGAAERFWQSELGLPAEQFYRTSRVTTRSSKALKRELRPHGTCHVTVYSTALKQKLNRWMELALGAVQQP